jgi:Protein of unknown function (DUF3551)
MRVLVAVCALLGVLLADARNEAQAQGSWCAWYDQSTYNCGFYSFEQCQANVRGIGGLCRRNYFVTRHNKRTAR